MAQEEIDRVVGRERLPVFEDRKDLKYGEWFWYLISFFIRCFGAGSVVIASVACRHYSVLDRTRTNGDF